MARYVILRHEEKVPPRRLPVIKIVRDGGSFLALIVPFFWLLWHRLWFAAAMVLLAGVAIALLVEAPVFANVGLPLHLIMGILVGLEGQNWRIARAGRQGYRIYAVVDAANRADAELKLAAGAGSPTANGASAAAPATPAAPVPDILFAVPEESRN